MAMREGVRRPREHPNRGSTVMVNYLLVLSIVTILGVGLFLSTGDLVESQQERAIRSDLGVIGNRLATELGSVDRLARSSGAAETQTVRRRLDLPAYVGGSTYSIAVGNRTTTGAYPVTLASSSPTVRVTVLVDTGTPIAGRAVAGGPVVIVYNGADGRVVIRNA